MQAPDQPLHWIICVSVVLCNWAPLSGCREQQSVLASSKYILLSTTMSWQILSKYYNWTPYSVTRAKIPTEENNGSSVICSK